MARGPDAYRDAGSEEMRLLGSFHIRTVFPDDVRAEVDALPRDPRKADFADREDLRGQAIFTIDGEDAEDYDDAIGIRRMPNGNVELGVHIADVSHYVRPGTALDLEAMVRGTSIYLPDQVIPMLPEKLSNELCSLVPKRDRLAHSVIMEFTPDGKRAAAWVHKSVIRSAQRATYRGVQELLDGRRTAAAKKIGFLARPLQLFRAWTQVQQDLREARGAVAVPLPSRKFIFEDGKVKAIEDAPRYFSQLLIEETALAANQAVGDLFRRRGLPAIYRVHPEKGRAEIRAAALKLAEHGIRVPDKERLTGRDIARMILVARQKPNAESVIQRIMGLLERAFYQVRDHDNVAGHFGLAREAYLHFTSPIRRYPDLLVHRWLHAIESKGPEAEKQLRADRLIRELNEMAEHSSMQAEVAEMAQRAIGDLKVCQFMAAHTGERHAAKISRVFDSGIELRLKKLNITAFLPAHVLGKDPEVSGPTLHVRSGRQSASYTEGSSLHVRVKDIDFLKLQVHLELA